ncbi:MAG: hypothetical protein IPK82_27140 [Polyangiaceae bacterium]|nr:hypothetical protein [Polyangiaceae bacterium]
MVWTSCIALMGCINVTADSAVVVPPLTSADPPDQSAALAISALKDGRFDDAERYSQVKNSKDSTDPYTHLVGAVVRYKKTAHQLYLDGRTIVVGGLESGNINQKYLASTLADAESELALVEKDLAVTAAHKGVSIELCVACWEVDWNGNGRLDERDRLLPQIEEDENGTEIPEGDPRRKPTFRFDDGDVAWARAFVAFQRAALNVLLAYDWTSVGLSFARRRDLPDKIVIKLIHPERIEQAKTRILEGLAQSELSRKLYLAEPDDDREWVPNPRQKNHPMPLPMDHALYSTWEGVVSDLTRLVGGDEGLAVADVFALADEETKVIPRGYIDIGQMFADAKDIVLHIKDLDRLDRERDIDGALKSVFGSYYTTNMKPSPLTKRLMRMKGEIDREDEKLSRKLRYLFWIN